MRWLKLTMYVAGVMISLPGLLVATTWACVQTLSARSLKMLRKKINDIRGNRSIDSGSTTVSH